MKDLQKLGRVRPIVKLCYEQYGDLNETIYNKCKKQVYNGISYELAMSYCKKVNIELSELNNINHCSIKDYLENRKNHKIKDIKIINIVDEPVYCLTNFEYENFALSSGVFVHNCRNVLYQFR